MESKKFIKAELKKIYSFFDDIEIRYEYRNSISTHIIEIKPIDFFKNNKNYILKEIELEKEFFNRFPEEDILFVTKDSLSQVKNPEFELIGYKMNYSLIDISSIFRNSNFEGNIIVAGENNYALAA